MRHEEAPPLKIFKEHLRNLITSQQVQKESMIKALASLLKNLEYIESYLPSSAEWKSRQVALLINNTAQLTDPTQLATALAANIKAYQYHVVRIFIEVLKEACITYISSIDNYRFFLPIKSNKQTIDLRQVKITEHKDTLHKLLSKLITCTNDKNIQDFTINIGRIKILVNQLDLDKERAFNEQILTRHIKAKTTFLAMLELIPSQRALIFKDKPAQDMLSKLSPST